MNVNGKYLNHLRFADDIVLVSENVDELEEMMNDLNREGKESGLEISIEKTKILGKKENMKDIRINQEKIEWVEEIVYLGQRIALENITRDEVSRRIKLAWQKYWSLKYIFKGNYKSKNKGEIMNSCVLPTLVYGSQTWATTKKEERKINTTYNTMLRSMMGIKLKDKIKITDIKKRINNSKNFVHEIRRMKWNWVGHVERIQDDRWTYRITNWWLREGRTKGKQKRRWRDEIVEFIKNKNYEVIARDRREWARLSEAYAQNLGLE